MPVYEPLPRHHWVWLKPDWTAHLQEPLPAAASNAVAGWVGRNRPFVVARCRPDDRRDCLRLGLSTLSKERIALQIDRPAIIRHEPPPKIDQCLTVAPPTWKTMLHAVMAAAEETGTDVTLYGSLAWQYWSDESYVHTDSDIDLLLSPPHWFAVERLLARLSVHDGALPRLDGELLLPKGMAVAWREWQGSAASVLVKTERNVVLRSRRSIIALLPGGGATAPAPP